MKKIWLFQIPVMAFFSFCYWVTDLGVQGQLENALLREKVYPVLSKAANLFTDIKFSVRGIRPPKNKIVVVEIDSPSIERLGRWPWHRDLTAYLIDKTFAAGAKVVGLDMVFSEPDPRISEELGALLNEKKLGNLIDQFETDPNLREVIRRHSDRLVVGWTTDMACQPLYEESQFCPVKDPEAIAQFPPGFDKFSFSHFNTAKEFDPTKTAMISFVTPLTNIPFFNEVAKHAGYFNAILDSDGHIRRTTLMAMAKGKPYASLPLEMARIGLDEDLQLTLDDQQRVVSLGFAKSGKNIPVTPLGGLQINFRGPSKVFTHLSAEDVLSEKVTIDDPMNRELAGQSKFEILKDAYVLIGVSAVGVFDMRQFPFEANAPGVYGHANILDNILSFDPLVPGISANSGVWMVLVMLIGVALFAYLVEKFDAIPALLLFLAVFSALWYVDNKFVFDENYNLNSVFLYSELGTVFILTLAAKYVLEERNKKFIRGAFAKYVPPSVVDSILKDPTKLSLGGEKRELTILFSDIRSFTTFSEVMDAKALASFLNDYLGIMTGLVFTNQGTLDKYIGDAIMAFWGAPLPQPLHAANACKAAIEMMVALEKNKERFKNQYGIDVNIGIGINSGVVNVGNMGSEQNFEYTVIGDHVNLASRLEGLTKKYGITIVTTRFTFDIIHASGQPFPPHRLLDDVKVKGKKKAVELIQILEREHSAEGLKIFGEGRQLYKDQKWDLASDKFKAANELLKHQGNNDGPCEVFIERCQYFKENPPAPDWDGSWEMDSK